jgi:hypothetical protein
VTRREKAAELRSILADYRGCRFSLRGSGGANGMLFLTVPDGRDYFIGGLNGGRGEGIVQALNLVLELIHET